MTGSGIDFYYLPVVAVGDLATLPFGKLNPALAHEAEVAPFTALDCFDQSLRRSGRLLLETDTTFELLSDDSLVVSQPVDGKVRFLTDFQNGPIKHALAGLSPLRSLLPVGSGQRHQATLALVDDDGKTHCRAHLMQLTTQKGHAAALVSLQGIKGYNESLNLLREHIRALGGIALSCGALYHQLFPAQSAYKARPEIFIASDETAYDAANRIISTYIPLMRANECGIIADHDTEFLHDYRVQLRKIRSVLSLFEGVYDNAQTVDLKARFSTLAAPTDRLRDLDVYLLEKQKYYDLLPESLHNGLNSLFSMFTRQRIAERTKLSRHLRSPAYKQKTADLAERFAKPNGVKRGANAGLPAHEYACDRIWRRYRKVCKIAAGIGPDTNDAEIHELRIHCKKLRYLMEFFGAVFPKTAFNRLLKSLKGLQNNLGLFNDYSVQQQSLRAFLLKLGRKRGDANLEVAQCVGALIAVLHRRQLEERAKVMKNFAQFNRPKIQQTFHELFQQRKDDT